MAGFVVCVLGLPLLSRPEASVVLGKNAQKGTENQLLENLGEAFLSWNAERDAGEMENQRQQENRSQPDVPFPTPPYPSL